MLAAILIAGRSGSAITAQIGVMRVTDELDAMRVMGISHSFRLVMPRAHGAGHRHAADQRLDHRCARLAGGMLAADLSLGITPDLLPERAARRRCTCSNLVLAMHQVGGVRHADRADRLPLRPAGRAQHPEPGRGHHGLGGDLDHGGDPGGRAVRRAVQTAWGSEGHGTGPHALPADGEPMVEIRKLWTVFTTPGKRFVVHQGPGPHRAAAARCCPSSAARAPARRCCCARSWGWRRRPRARSRCWASRWQTAGAAAARPAASACCSSTARCSRPSACWRTSPFRCANSRRCRAALMREAAMVKLQMVGLKPERRGQDAVRPVRRHDQAGGAGAGADHGPAAAAAGRAHGRPGPGELRRLRARCCARCTATWR